MCEVKYFQPRSLEELTTVMGQLPAGFQTVAGTTDFIPQARRGVPYPTAILDISRVEEFKQVTKADGRIQVGAAVTMAELLANEIIVADCPVLASAAKSLGSPLTRNRATIGGNIANASPSADTAPALLVLGATVHFLGTDGSTRELPLSEFFLDYKKTAMNKGELITGFSFPVPDADCWYRFAKVGQRDGAAISVVNMAVMVKKDGKSCADLAVAFGAVGPVPLRACTVEKTAKGGQCGDDFIAACKKAVQEDISPISDIRGSGEYRRYVAANVLARALTDAFA